MWSTFFLLTNKGVPGGPHGHRKEKYVKNENPNKSNQDVKQGRAIVMQCCG